MEVLDDFLCYRAGHGRASAIRVADGFEQLFGRAGFDEVTVGARFEGFEDAVAVFIDRDHDDLDFREQTFEFADALDARHAWQLDVHEYDVRQVFWNMFQSLLACGEVSDAFDVRRAAKDFDELVSQS